MSRVVARCLRLQPAATALLNPSCGPLPLALAETAPYDGGGLSERPTMIGQTLGHYRVLEKLGAGGMGVVYRAHDEQLDRDVAVKVLPADALGNGIARDRLLREARLASKLNHPHICTIHEVGEAGPSAGSGQAVSFIAVELVEGEPLSARLARGGLPVASSTVTSRAPTSSSPRRAAPRFSTSASPSTCWARSSRSLRPRCPRTFGCRSRRWSGGASRKTRANGISAQAT